MVERIKRAREGVGETHVDYDYRLAVSYQIVGALLDRLGVFDTEKGQSVLDYLNGDDVPDPLPLTWESFGVAPPALDTAARVGDDARLEMDLATMPAQMAIERANKVLGKAYTAVDAMVLITGCPRERALESAMVTWPNVPSKPSIPTPTGRAEALEEAAQLLEQLAREDDQSIENAQINNKPDVETFFNGSRNGRTLAAEKIRALSSAPTPQAVTVDDESAIKGAIMLSNRRDALGLCVPKCLKCGHTQVQLVRSNIVPAEWKCRICKNQFLFEPDAQNFIHARNGTA